jgi:hypothetical protein
MGGLPCFSGAGGEPHNEWGMAMVGQGRISIWRCRAALLVCLLGVPVVAPAHAEAAAMATAIQAKKIAIQAYLRALPQQKQMLVGVQVNEFEVYLDCTSADRLAQLGGSPPAMLGLELMNTIAVPPYGRYVVDRALTQTAAGGLVTLTWHARNPMKTCVRGEYFDCTQMPMDAATLRAMLTKGTPENKRWLADVDVIAKLLRQLRDQGVVVLFRPYHEMNGNWFWWGKQDGYPQLWDALYDELAGRRKLDNLIWVWSSDRETPDAKRYVPVRHLPDVAGIDVYEPDAASPKFAEGRSNLAAAFGAAMPFAVTEVGHLPDRKVLDAINPAWVLMWGGEYIDATLAMKGDCRDCNTAQAVAQFIGYDRTLMLDEMPAAFRAAVARGVVNGSPLHPGKSNCPVLPH